MTNRQARRLTELGVTYNRKWSIVHATRMINNALVAIGKGGPRQ